MIRAAPGRARSARDEPPVQHGKRFSRAPCVVLGLEKKPPGSTTDRPSDRPAKAPTQHHIINDPYAL